MSFATYRTEHLIASLGIKTIQILYPLILIRNMFQFHIVAI
nr:MAG TPA: hypothetical protein [Caudoviricetes sp.]